LRLGNTGKKLEIAQQLVSVTRIFIVEENDNYYLAILLYMIYSKKNK